MKKLKNLCMAASCLLVLYSCNNPKQKNSEGFQFKDELKQSDIEVTKSFIYLFPSPGEILDRFYNADLAFVDDVLHDPASADNYLTSKDKGLNLGIYLTDMAYTALFSRSSEAVDYLDVVKTLSSELNISSAAFGSLIDRAKNNLGESDSLVTISNEVFFNMVEFLESSGMENTIAVISCGAYVESMYIALSAVEQYNQDNPILQQIAELKYPMENLLSHAESVSDDPNVQSILKYITELNGLFMELESKASKVEKSAPGVISLSGGTAPELNAENFQEMKELVMGIRENIVGK